MSRAEQLEAISDALAVASWFAMLPAHALGKRDRRAFAAAIERGLEALEAVEAAEEAAQQAERA